VALMRLAVCAEMMFLDLPITERVQRIAEAGFDAEIWDWTRHDIEALAATGAMFSSMTGYIRGDFGDGADELIRTARESIAVAETLGCPRLNLHGTGLDGRACRWCPDPRCRARCGYQPRAP
jgi:hydroxypyruvate isomerase